MVCIKPSQIFDGMSYDVESRFELSFGEMIVPIKFIQPGVFKCNAPPHEPGFVHLNLLFEGNVITVKQSGTEVKYGSSNNIFEYR